jgi:helicase-like protein
MDSVGLRTPVGRSAPAKRVVIATASHADLNRPIQPTPLIFQTLAPCSRSSAPPAEAGAALVHAADDASGCIVADGWWVELRRRRSRSPEGCRLRAWVTGVRCGPPTVSASSAALIVGAVLPGMHPWAILRAVERYFCDPALNARPSTCPASGVAFGGGFTSVSGPAGQRPAHPGWANSARFWKNPPDCHVIVSTEAGSEGVDLQVANVLVNYDLPWNPMIVEQRIGRIQRLASEHASVSCGAPSRNTSWAG